MGNPSREAWDALTEADFIHSCDCIVCKSLRDDSGRSCSGCAVHHVANKALRARIALLKKVAAAARIYLLGDKHICPDDCSSYNALSDALRAYEEG